MTLTTHHAAVAAAYAARFGEAAAPSVTFDGLTVDVPSAEWVAALEFARDELGARFFDWLTAVDRLDEGFDVVAHVCAPAATGALPRAAGFLLRTRVPRDRPELATATGVFHGADWHERETHEMFGVAFAGHPNLVPLLLPDGFEGTPLRKDFVLASRVAKVWPGAKEPGESDAHAAPARRRMTPPGVPDGWLDPLPDPEATGSGS